MRCAKLVVLFAAGCGGKKGTGDFSPSDKPKASAAEKGFAEGALYDRVRTSLPSS